MFCQFNKVVELFCCHISVVLRFSVVRSIILEYYSVAKDVDADFVKELTVDVRYGTGDKTLAADGENLAHGIATTDDAFRKIGRAHV